MTFAPYLAHTEPIFNSLELLPVEKIFINRVGIVMFKYSCDMLPDLWNTISNKMNVNVTLV